jgi:hypothetical protein
LYNLDYSWGIEKDHIWLINYLCLDNFWITQIKLPVSLGLKLFIRMRRSFNSYSRRNKRLKISKFTMRQLSFMENYLTFFVQLDNYCWILNIKMFYVHLTWFSVVKCLINLIDRTLSVKRVYVLLQLLISSILKVFIFKLVLR